MINILDMSGTTFFVSNVRFGVARETKKKSVADGRNSCRDFKAESKKISEFFAIFFSGHFFEFRKNTKKS